MKPNIVIFLSDEETNPRGYESEELKIWRKKNMPLANFFDIEGLTMKHHYTNETACRPARAVLQTGKRVQKHKVNLTDGFSLNEEDINDIDPKKTPTLGNYLTKNGYNCYYKGKQHMKKTHLDGKNDDLLSHGYKGWKPPDGHGSDMLIGSAYFRDKEYTKEALELIPDLVEPYCYFFSPLNPHDIALLTAFNMRNRWWGNFCLWYLRAPSFSMNIDNDIPDCTDWPTDKADLNDRPSAQRSYREVYKKMITNPLIHENLHSDLNLIRRFYFSLIKQVQHNFWTVFQAFQKHPSYDNTYFFYTSDHGEQNGTQGLFGKWHNSYEETINVPFQVFHPSKKLQKLPENILTSHLDIVPTILGLTETEIPKHLEGRNLTPYLLGEKCWNIIRNSRVKFQTMDDVTNGPDNYPLLIKRLPLLYKLGLRPYKGVKGSRFIQCEIKAYKNKIYKYSVYYDPNGISEKEEEMYELVNDPYEQENLAKSINFTKLKNIYFKTLNKKHFAGVKKRYQKKTNKK